MTAHLLGNRRGTIAAFLIKQLRLTLWWHLIARQCSQARCSLERPNLTIRTLKSSISRSTCSLDSRATKMEQAKGHPALGITAICAQERLTTCQILITKIFCLQGAGASRNSSNLQVRAIGKAFQMGHPSIRTQEF